MIGFLHAVSLVPNVRALAEPELIARLENYLYYLRKRLGGDAPAKAARDYQLDWADSSRGWLRRY